MADRTPPLDSGAWFERQVATETAAVSHNAFVSGIRNGSMKVVPFKGNAYDLIRGTGRKKIFACHVIAYLAAPLIGVPLWAWQQRNAWILFGILSAYMAIFITRGRGLEHKQYGFGAFLMIATVLAWIVLGRHNYWTVHLTCALGACFLYLASEETQQRYVRESLIENPDHFDWAVNEKRIWIVTKPG